ncbi:MAG: ribbon-helix-helix protein, CopG family [Acidimicrobiales bacterium]
MRTTVDLDPDAARAIDRLRREEGMGLSEAVNTLIRRGLLPRPEGEAFRQQTRSLGLTIDISNVAEALDVLEGPDHR